MPVPPTAESTVEVAAIVGSGAGGTSLQCGLGAIYTRTMLIANTSEPEAALMTVDVAKRAGTTAVRARLQVIHQISHVHLEPKTTNNLLLVPT